MTVVVCVELAPQVGRLDANLAACGRAIAEAADRGAEVIVLPELATSGYCFDSLDEARSVALPGDAPVFGEWGRRAGDAVVVAGFAEDGGAVLHNSAVVADGSGIRAVYRKVHLWNTEQLFFEPGTEPAPVVDTAAGRIGAMVCYDLEFPEMTRAVAARGAELLAVPTNWPEVDHPAGTPVPEVVIAMAAARVNRMAVACCDRRGVERGHRWNEATTIVGADGWVAATADEAGFARADLDLAAARDKRISPRNDALGDRVPEVYR